MDDPFDILDCALRSRYVTPEALPALPVWERLPSELRIALAEALVAGKQLSEVVPLLWRVRSELHGKPARDGAGERTQATAALRLGLLYLAHREGRFDPAELLTRAFHVADSYVCGVDPRPFLRLRNELAAGRAGGCSVEGLFGPYIALAEQCVQQWGFRPNEPRPAEPLS